MSLKPGSYGRLPPRALEHRRRCVSLPPPRSGEVEQMVAKFLATNSVTACPARYVLPVEQRPLYNRAGY